MRILLQEDQDSGTNPWIGSPRRMARDVGRGVNHDTGHRTRRSARLWHRKTPRRAFTRRGCMLPNRGESEHRMRGNSKMQSPKIAHDISCAVPIRAIARFHAPDARRFWESGGFPKSYGADVTLSLMPGAAQFRSVFAARLEVASSSSFSSLALLDLPRKYGTHQRIQVALGSVRKPSWQAADESLCVFCCISARAGRLIAFDAVTIAAQR